MSTRFEDVDAVKMYIARLNHIDWKKDFIEDTGILMINGNQIVAAYTFTAKRNDLTEEQRKGRITICEFMNGVCCWLVAPNGMCVRL